MNGSRRVIGVDACRKGWVGVTNDEHAYFGSSIGALVETAQGDGFLDVVAIDIPIGLPGSSTRGADVEARKKLGPRRSSVFLTPTRQALEAATHAEGSAANRTLTEKGMTQQAYALRRKIFEVEDWMASSRTTVIEIHPELSFACMAGDVPMAHPKSTWAGVQERRALLERQGIRLRGDMGLAGQMATVDDVLDAAAACWSAIRHANGESHSTPDEPEMLEGGVVAAIWT